MNSLLFDSGTYFWEVHVHNLFTIDSHDANVKMQIGMAFLLTNFGDFGYICEFLFVW